LKGFLFHITQRNLPIPKREVNPPAGGRWYCTTMWESR
jgi:hypothetical protein